MEMEQVLADKAPARAGEWAVVFQRAKANVEQVAALVEDEDKAGKKAWAAAKGKAAAVAAVCAAGSPRQVMEMDTHGEVIARDNAFKTKEDTRCQVEMEQARAAWDR